MIHIRLTAFSMALILGACGGNMQRSKDPAVENVGAGGEPYTGGEPTRMPPDPQHAGPTPERNDAPMSSIEMSAATPSLVSTHATNAVEPAQFGPGGAPGAGGGIGVGGSIGAGGMKGIGTYGRTP